MKIEVYATLTFEGIHSWPACPHEDVRYLREPHRHLFHVKAFKQVTHADRDIEFIRFRKELKDYVKTLFPSGDMKNTSCEMLASELCCVFDLSKCEVSEDGENGAVVSSDEAPAPAEQEYKDPSADSRSSWEGVEVEGRLKGISTVFLTKLPLTLVTDAFHVFLCPTIAQNEDPALVEHFVTEQTNRRKFVTVAVKPKDLDRLTPYVRVRAHIMVDIDLHGATWLKPSDTIKIETAPYTTLSTTTEQMVATTPSAYSSDR